MLTDQEKQKILLEEKYRNQVRNKLEKNNKKLSIWSFLNSNFGSFILSTVIVGLISIVYNNHRADITKQEKLLQQVKIDNQKESQLKTELNHRLNTIIKIADTLKPYEKNDIYLAYWGTSIGNGIDANYYNFKSFYPEYANYPIVRLVHEIIKYDSSEKYIQLGYQLENLNQTIIDLGQTWYYKITYKNNQIKILPPNENIRNDNNRNIQFFRTKDGDIPTKNLKSWERYYYIDNIESIQNILKSINNL